MIISEQIYTIALENLSNKEFVCLHCLGTSPFVDGTGSAIYCWDCKNVMMRRSDMRRMKRDGSLVVLANTGIMFR